MMIKYTRFFITFLLALIVFQARSQSTATTSSPYSRYGLGDITPQVLPQNIAMGDLSVATNSLNGYSDINPLNPASYGKIALTVADVGIYGSSLTLNQTGQKSQTDGNFRLSHVAFAFPVTKHSALSFGLLPYSEFGYNYKITSANLGTSSSVDTNAVNHIYSGEGGLSKAYLGYGFGIGKHLLLGANVSYIFGKLKEYSSTEIPNLAGTLDSRVENDYAIGGVDYDFGGQYTIDLSATKHIIFGYSGSSSSSITSQYSSFVSLYTYDSSGNQNVPIDTLASTKNPKDKIKLPMINHFGLTFVNDNKLLVGAEYSTSNWSQLTIGGVNQGLQNSKTYNLGASFTPNIYALNNYWATVDYKLGVIYDQTYIDVNNPLNNTNTNIKNYALTFGLGLPLRPNVTSFYKINFSAEVGRRGTLDNGLIKENYVNLHLSFTLNDRWFMKYKIGQE
ncbi:hypothetical protein [Mucilaginibacter mallensis]|nr:hypothetical protein [Mucilaginibacter mallensis]